MIEIKNVSKRYGEKFAVQDATFTINDNEILGFLGRNGAGKSTTMNIITGYISSSDGRVTIDGYDILESPREAKKHIGYLPELPPLYLDMTVDEYLIFVSEIKGVKRRNRRAHLLDVCELTRIIDVRGRLIKNLSKGYKQRVGMAQALVGNPKTIIMDEPTIGLDPRQIIEVRKLIRDLGRDHTVVLSSHILHEVADVAQRVVIINQGKIVAQDTMANLTHGISGSVRLQVKVMGTERQALHALRNVHGVRDVTPMGSNEAGTVDLMVESDVGNDVRRGVFQALASAGLPLLGMESMDMSLEDIFLKITAQASGEEQV
jgi:ABC-2 type transport system ATP-binding protein